VFCHDFCNLGVSLCPWTQALAPPWGKQLNSRPFLGLLMFSQLRGQQLPAVLSAIFNAKYAFLNFGANS
jgi:hypothetical protein